MPIGQLVFYTTERAENPYDKKADAKYLDQRQATLSRYPGNKKYGPGNARNQPESGAMRVCIYLKIPFYSDNRSGLEMKQCDFF